MVFGPGTYTLRASPVVGFGGMYATGDGIDEVVTVISLQYAKSVSRHGFNSSPLYGTYPLMLFY